jgi:UDP-N-acetylmuramoyl-L-alanyl-D-glutamate--2,6-diaminopimelate ligase
MIRKKLSKLIKNLSYIKITGSLDPEITGLSYDSRDAKPGDIFFAFDGVHTDGHLFIDKALDKGAKAVVHSMDLKEYKSNIIYIKVNKTRPALSKLASEFYGNPSLKLKVIGVTGTDGKSTTVWLIHQLLTFFNKASGFISTVSMEAKGKNVKNPYRQSTPEAREIQEFLGELADSGAEYAVIEATSHGLSKKTSRLADVDFNAAVLTNVTHEHLEFHGTLDQYRKDKANLFSMIRPEQKPAFGIVNMDDDNWKLFKESCVHPVYTYSMINREANLFTDRINAENKGYSFRLTYNKTEVYDIYCPLEGDFNICNLMASVLTVKELLGLPLSSFADAVKNIKPVKGRMEIIDEGQSFKVIVDYAHTPKSFEKIFPYIKSRTEGKLISVFGSAGERDTEKRELQGRIASEYSDIIILADEDPRGEDRIKILNDIASGCNSKVLNKDLFLIADRREAIKHAFEMAQRGDTVICLGKGHESSIIYEKASIPWNEIETAKQLLREL